MSHTTDVVVIGAGPVGLFSVFQCGMLGLRCHIIDSLEIPGGQCAALYPDKPIYDIPAWPKITGAALIDHLIQQTEPFQPTFHLNQQVVSLQQRDGQGQTWLIETNKGLVIQARAIIIAAGIGAFGPQRPPLAGIEAYEGYSIFYAIRSQTDFANKRIVIAGGGDSAVDWAIALAQVAQKIYVVHRRDRFRAMPDSEARLRDLAQAGKVELVVPYQLHGLQGTGNQLEGVEVETLSGERRILEADVLLPFFGLSNHVGPILEWGLKMEHQHIVINPSTGETNRPGIYAAGDVATYPNKLKLILCGFAEAAQASHAVRKFLYPHETLHFEHSTTKAVPLVA